MKTIFRNIILLAFMALASFHASAYTVPHDTIYFYSTWQQILDVQPVAMIVDSVCDAVSPYEIYIETGLEHVNETIKKDYIALSQGDSLWLINGDYLKRNFGGDAKNINGFSPFFFDEKTAFVVSPRPMNVKDILLGNNVDGMTSYGTPEYYYIDFLNKRVERVTYTYLDKLLEDYRDLQMRYEGMKDYKKSYIIEDYFFKFVDRVSQDIMRPYILDLVDQ